MTTTATQDLTEVLLPGLVGPDGVRLQRRPVPAPGKGQALVEMLATGVSFAENSMLRGRYPGQPKFPFVLGYDLVGVVNQVGVGVDPALVGRRVAAVTRTGAWSTQVLLDARDLLPVPDELDPAEVETVLVNGITAWQLLHRKARVSRGQTVLVHGASGGVGTILVQLARHAGLRVLGTGSPRHHDAIRALGAEPLDYRDPRLVERVRELAPGGCAAVFDHLGGASFRRSFDLLARGGTLVGYGTASQRDDTNNIFVAFAGILATFAAWSLLPNGRKAVFYNFWAGKHAQPRRFRFRLARDLTAVLALLADGTVTAQVAARVQLRDAARALTLADARDVPGKVIILP